MSDFQKSFLARGGMTMYTQKEFDDQLAIAKAQIMQVAIETTKTAIALEREECAKLVDVARKEMDAEDSPMIVDITLQCLADKIRNRLKK